ncbi:MAG: FAD:protein FMN transferase [Bacteroidales bacterium]|jgi:thiamine biosynthesis lipoprotein|nr:FAD:protein FMN transferase [Bacteroidales bacterium]
MKVNMKVIFETVCLSFVVLIAVSCGGKQASVERITLDGLIQGTYYHIVYYSPTTDNSLQVKQGINRIFKAVDASLSLWNEESVLSKANNGENIELDSIFIDNFNLSQEISKLTDGAFDITIGNLVKAYGFANKQRIKLSDAQIDSLLQGVDYRKVAITADKRLKKLPVTSLDFNAIAQGYTTDLISSYLLSVGINDFVVDVGGEVFAHGSKPNNEAWLVAIEEPSVDSLSEQTYKKAVYLRNESIVTSGSYRKYYVENGIKYSHTIDPRNGKPVTHSLLSVSVIAKKSYEADGLATAFMVMGLERSKAFLAHHTEYDAYFIYSDTKGNYATYATAGFQKKIQSN